MRNCDILKPISLLQILTNVLIDSRAPKMHNVSTTSVALSAPVLTAID